jgi:hypothetical protein
LFCQLCESAREFRSFYAPATLISVMPGRPRTRIGSRGQQYTSTLASITARGLHAPLPLNLKAAAPLVLTLIPTSGTVSAIPLVDSWLRVTIASEAIARPVRSRTIPVRKSNIRKPARTNRGVDWRVKRRWRRSLSLANNRFAQKLLCCNAFISVMKPAELWNCDNLSNLQRLSRKRTLLIEA